MVLRRKILGTISRGRGISTELYIYTLQQGCLFFSVSMSSVGSIRISKSLKMLKNEEEIFVSKEKETQMFLFLLLILHVVFILPLNIFK